MIDTKFWGDLATGFYRNMCGVRSEFKLIVCNRTSISNYLLGQLCTFQLFVGGLIDLTKRNFRHNIVELLNWNRIIHIAKYFNSV